MADPDRRGAAGGEPPLTLEDRRGGGGRGPAPVMLIISVLVLAVMVAGVVWLYRGGSRGPGDAPQPVGVPLRDVRVAAPAQPKPADPAAGLSIYKDNSAAPASPTFAPGPEQPGPRPGAAPAPAPAPADKTDAIGALAERSAPDARPQKLAQADVKPPVHAASPSKETAKATPEAAKTTPNSAAAAGPAEVQIGAFSTRAMADEAWTADAAAAPGAMAGRSKRVTQIERDGRTLYRVSITGFASREAATALCGRLKAAAHSCIVR